MQIHVDSVISIGQQELYDREEAQDKRLARRGVRRLGACACGRHAARPHNVLQIIAVHKFRILNRIVIHVLPFGFWLASYLLQVSQCFGSARQGTKHVDLTQRLSSEKRLSQFPHFCNYCCIGFVLLFFS
jgi:hypothetical protein